MLNIIEKLCMNLRVIPAIEDSKNTSMFWSVYIIVSVVVFIITILFIYTILCPYNNQRYFTLIINFLREILTLVYWILYAPFMETYMTIFKCEDGNLKIDSSIVCYEGMHIFFVTHSLIFSIILLTLLVLISFFFNETQPVIENSFAKVNDNIEIGRAHV